MKKILTSFIRLSVLAGVVLVSAQQLAAQGNQDDNFLFGVSNANVNSVYRQEACGYGYAQFGASVQEELCADIVWAYDVTPDSICCDTITMDLTGKFAFIRRGTCNFSIKAYYAQQQGAIGVIIANNYSDATQDGCSVIGMAAGTYADLITIPCIFVCRNVAEQIDGELQAGNPVEGCFLLPRVTDGFAAYSFAVPKTQLDTMSAMSINFINRSGAEIPAGTVTVKADITGPNGYTASVSTVQDVIAVDAEGLLFVDNYMPPAVNGVYNVTLSNDFYTESRDTVRRSFAVTDYTFAVDNAVEGNPLQLDGGADRNDLFVQGGLKYQTGALYLTNANEAVATHVTFGVANIDSVYAGPGNDEANSVYILLYDGDADEDGAINLTADFSDVENDLVASGLYILQGDETEDNLLDVALDDFLSPGQSPTLKANHPYYVSILYDGTFNGSGRNLAFTNSSNEAYLIIAGGPTSPMFLGQFYTGGWSDRTIVQRLQLQGYGSAVKPPLALSTDKFSITPNPGSEYVNLNLSLSQVNDKVSVTIFSHSGQIQRQEVMNNFQEGTVRFDVKTLPTGTYMMAINTKEGYSLQKVVVCH